MAIVSVGCMASCTLFKDHDDGICDLCDKKEGLLFPVVQWEKNKELCNDCADKEYTDEEQESLLKDMASDAIEDILGGGKAD